MANLPAVIKRLKNGTKTKYVYPETLTKAVYDEETGERLDNTVNELIDSLANVLKWKSYKTVTGMTNIALDELPTNFNEIMIDSYSIRANDNVVQHYAPIIINKSMLTDDLQYYFTGAEEQENTNYVGWQVNSASIKLVVFYIFGVDRRNVATTNIYYR